MKCRANQARRTKRNPEKEVFHMAILDLQGLEVAGRREAEAAASSVSVSC
ncbi:hypothetical protein GCM10023080_070160 [Streptomyces pseudoechinosporeus]